MPDIEMIEIDEEEGGLLSEDLGLCPYCGASDDEGCDYSEPHPVDE